MAKHLSTAGGATLDVGGVRSWIFDLDNTLYDWRCDLFGQIDKRMTAFIAERFGLDQASARSLQKLYFAEHGTTLRGLMREHAVDPTAFLDYVHDIDFSALSPEPRLRRALQRLPGRKLVFTNADSAYAWRVIERLGVADCIEAVFDIADADFEPKPEPETYRRMVRRHGVDPSAALMVEDIARNLKPAADLGMTTAWLRTGSRWGKEGSEGEHVHYVIDDLAAWLDSLSVRAG